MNRCLPIVLALLSLTASTALADGPVDGVFALYSDVCYNRDSTDLTGTRIGLLTMVEATYLFYQETAGIDVTPPRVFKLAKGALIGSKLKLQLDKNITIQATVTDTAIDGHFYNLGTPTDTLHLSRMTAQEKFFPNCK